MILISLNYRSILAEADSLPGCVGEKIAAGSGFNVTDVHGFEQRRNYRRRGLRLSRVYRYP